ncbi:MAG: HlyD family efflux transporter periplasmic adaptor subunit [Planctomycetes bacterium]|nr:HlyD family efflux transporter periplasmic adaptor subunit [Planctomycetota bacterium]
MLRRLLLALLALAVLAVGAAGAKFLIDLRKPPARDEPPRAVRRVRVRSLEREDVQVLIRGYGTIRARDRLSIRPEVGGTLIGVSPNLEPGMRVAKDEVLLRIDPRPFELAIAASKAEIEGLRAGIERLRTVQEQDRTRLETLRRSLALAEAEYERVRALLEEDGVGSRAAVETAERAYLRERDAVALLENAVDLTPVQIKELEAKVAAATARLEQQGIDLARATIRSPVDARVERADIEERQVIRAGEEAAQIEDLTRLEVPVPLDARDLAWLPFDPEKEDAFAGYGPVRVEWAQGSGATWTGRLGRIERFDDRTRTIVLVVEIENDAPAIRDGLHPTPQPGMFCRIEFPGRTARNVCRVPRELVRQDGTVPLVAEGRLRLAPVDVVRWEAADALIGDGLRPGDTLVLSPIPLAVEGSELAPEDGGAPAPAPEAAAEASPAPAAPAPEGRPS